MKLNCVRTRIRRRRRRRRPGAWARRICCTPTWTR